MAKKYVIANWKMNPLGLKEAKNLFSKVKKGLPKLKNTKVVICPPFVYLGILSGSYSGSKLLFGAQDSFYQNKGPFTGEISPTQIKDAGALFVIIGHSEKRAQGETNEVISKKISAALASGLNVILCVGENERDEEGNYLEFIKNELKLSLKGVSKKTLSKIIIAYEPIWAIGKSEEKAMTAENVHQMKLFITKTLKDVYGSAGMNIPIIYGGSAAPENASKIISEGHVDGLLVGHESLVASDFLEIIKVTDYIK